MKAAAATELLVFKTIARQVPFPLGLQLVTDEEVGGFKGTGHQAEQGVRADFVVTGEATNLDLNNERKGVLVLKLTTETGRPGHAAYPWNGDNAIMRMAKFLTDLDQRYPIPDEGSWATSMNVASFETSNKEHNKIPSNASVLLDFRHIPEDTPYSIQQSVEELSPANTTLEIKAQGVSSYTSPEHPDMKLLEQAILEVTNRSPDFIKKHGSSDTRHMLAVGASGVDFGPTGEGLHSEVEYVEIDSLEQYAQVLMRFLTSIKA